MIAGTGRSFQCVGIKNKYNLVFINDILCSDVVQCLAETCVDPVDIRSDVTIMIWAARHM